MKAICTKSNNRCEHLLGDDVLLDMAGWQDGNSNNMPLINGIKYVTYKSDELDLYTDVTEVRSGVTYLKGSSYTVDSWRGGRYEYDGTNWTQNNKYTFLCESITGGKMCKQSNAYNATTCTKCGASTVGAYPTTQ